MATAQARTRNTQNKGEEVANEAKQASKSPLMQNLTRYGYVARGVLFAVIGYLALQLALGRPGQPPDQTGALAAIAQQPFGKTLLIVVLIGLIGYSLWGFIRAIFDPLHRGKDSGGMLERLGFVVSGISYGVLVIPAYQIISGANSQPKSSTQKTQDVTAQIMQQPWGPWLIAVVGGMVIVWALWQLYTAFTGKFEVDFKSHVMTSLERKWAEPIGRIGISARAVVFLLVGAFLIQSGLQHNPQQAVGLDGALFALLQLAYGHWLLMLAGLGLIVFGIYSVLAARWMDVT